MLAHRVEVRARQSVDPMPVPATCSVVPELQRPRVLVLEDDRVIAAAITRCLTDAGYDVLCVGDGSDAIAVIEKRHVDAAVLDFHVPGVDGVRVMERIAECHPEAACVLTTGSLDLDMAVLAVNRGNVRRILPKPFRMPELLHLLGEALEHNQRISNVMRLHEREAMEAERVQLLECLDGQVQLALQPIVTADRADVVAYEALLRSQHPQFRSPLDVIGACERHGLINYMGAVVGELAEKRLRALDPAVKLFINLHPAQLHDAESLEEQLAPLLPHASRVVLEITERADLESVEGWMESTARLTALGFDLAADDLGAGYNSLALLAQLKPRYIKIDMSIVRDIHLDASRRGVLELVCQFGRATQSSVIAEGIENELERAACTECGADLLQGYHFGRPQL